MENAIICKTYGMVWRFVMKPGAAACSLGWLATLILILAIPCLARSNSDTRSIPIVARTSTDQPAAEPRQSTTSSDSNGSWQQFAGEAVRDAEAASQKAYNRLAGDVGNVSLEGRVMAVLHENKWTRDSDVQVMADNGIVTLTGNVPSERSAIRVQEVVASVYGVKAVKSELNYPSARGTVTPPDADSMGVAHPAYSDTAPAENAPN
jgi:BON domain-containing protein